VLRELALGLLDDDPAVQGAPELLGVGSQLESRSGGAGSMLPESFTVHFDRDYEILFRAAP
jgi:hypothetical protein